MTRQQHRYKAFISYRHDADKEFAEALQFGLQQFGGEALQLRSINVFRDATDLAPGNSLPDRIQDALRDSEWFILLATPECTASAWVAGEVGYWLDHRELDHLIILWVRGTIQWNQTTNDDFDWSRTDALPPAMRHRFTSVPLWEDWRELRGPDQLSLSHKAFFDSIARLAAALHGRDVKDMVGQEVERLREVFTTAFETLDQLVRRSEANGVAALDNDDLPSALAWFAEAARRDRKPPQWEAPHLDGFQPDWQRRQHPHRLRLASLSRMFPDLDQILFADGPIEQAELNPTGDRLLTVTAEGIIRVWDVELGLPVGQPIRHGGATVGMITGDRRAAAFHPDDKRIITALTNLQTNHVELCLWDIASGRRSAGPAALAGRCGGMCLSPDGQRALAIIVSAGGLGQTPDDADRHNAVLGASDDISSSVLQPVDLASKAKASSAASHVMSLELADELAELAGQAAELFAGSLDLDGADVETPVNADRFDLPTSQPATVVVFDTTTLETVSRLVGHGGLITHASFSRDNLRIVTTSMDLTARVWEVDSGEPVTEPLSHEFVPNYATFDPLGEQVITAGSDGAARVWDVATGEHVPHVMWHSGGVGHAFLTGLDAVTTSVHSLGPGIRVGMIEKHGELRFWDRQSGQPVTPPLAHQDKILAVAFSEQAYRVATGSQDGTARVWDRFQRGAITPALPHSAEIVYCGFSNEGQRLVTASRDGTARVWNLASLGRPIPPLIKSSREPRRGESPDQRQASPLEQNAGRHLAINAEATRLLTVDSPSSGGVDQDNVARLWDARTGESIGNALECDSPIELACFSEDGSRLLTSSGQGAANFDFSWLQAATMQLAAGSLAPVPQPETKTVGQARLWHGDDGALVSTELEHVGYIIQIGFSPDSRFAFTAGGSDGAIDGDVRLWDAVTGKMCCPPLEHPSAVQHVDWSPDAARLATLGMSGQVQTWRVAMPESGDAPRIEAVALTQPFALGVETLSISPDGGRVALGTGDGDVRVCEVESGEFMRPRFKHLAGVVAIKFAPDGQRLAVASKDGVVRVWDAVTGRPVTPPLSQPGVLHVAFSPDGQLLLACSDQGTARVWRADTGFAVTPNLSHEHIHVDWARFTADGRRAVTRSFSHVHVWDLSYSDEELSDVLLRCESLASRHVDSTEGVGVAQLDWSLADDHLDFVARQHENDWMLRLRRAKSFAARQRWEQALSETDAALAAGGDDIELWRQRAETLSALERPAAAAHAYTRAMTLGTATSELLQFRGRAHLLAGDARAAIEDYTRVLAPQNEPLDASAIAARFRALHERGLCHGDVGDWKSAIADLRIVVDSRELESVLLDIGPWQALTLAHLADGDLAGYRRARQEMCDRLSPRQDPESAKAVAWSFAVCQPEVGDNLDLAVQLARQARRSQPDNPRSASTLGAVLTRAGRLNEALTCCESAWNALPEQEDERPATAIQDWVTRATAAAFATLIHLQQEDRVAALEWQMRAKDWFERIVAAETPQPSWPWRIVVERLLAEIQVEIQATGK